MFYVYFTIQRRLSLLRDKCNTTTCRTFLKLAVFGGAKFHKEDFRLADRLVDRILPVCSHILSASRGYIMASAMLDKYYDDVIFIVDFKLMLIKGKEYGKVHVKITR